MDNDQITRRMLVLSGLALLTSGCSTTWQGMGVPVPSLFGDSSGIDPRYRRRHVRYEGYEAPGTLVVDTNERYLYAVEEGGWATRYGIGVGEQGLTMKGRAVVGRKAEWPSWTPTASMIKRKPHLAQYAGGVSGGPHNPLGASALYLYRGGQDTMFRVHGTNEPWTIGHAVSNGCIRMTNEDIVDLYSRTPVGTEVLII
ncbi:L,D-transpeptidase [Sinorhizobium terangae]|uniref:L,D-transpeptidase family protein n=1 Tax=Sinorhizobium terangae TaxID=110322 RepID=A0A6N7LJC3_SINTE|nr:L,D-transpeptidase [Sinorhizobium terangae]MQX16844.1 L,D-transpeptidase family protein [Sinorhizobium terangae]WFU50589.1 L,D-transpeptidase [Sinorhizobium terangae]